MSEAHPVHTLEDLKTWSRPGTHLAVLGFPIHHSISPAMHNAALEILRSQHPHLSDWSYHRFEIHPDSLPESLPLFLDKGFLGLNLTLPHKILATKLVESTEAAALAIGALNTLKATGTGWRGTNTDAQGMADGILADLSLSLNDRPVILLGAGGAARAAAVQCLRDHCSSLTIINRSAESLTALLAVLAPLHATIAVQGFTAESLPQSLPRNAVVINATSAGLKPSDPLPLDLTRLPSPCAVYDMIYNPPTTALMSRARELGIPASNGLSMLVNQGARALEYWTGLSAPVATMSAAAEHALALR